MIRTQRVKNTVNSKWCCVPAYCVLSYWTGLRSIGPHCLAWFGTMLEWAAGGGRGASPPRTAPSGGAEGGGRGASPPRPALGGGADGGGSRGFSTQDGAGRRRERRGSRGFSPQDGAGRRQRGRGARRHRAAARRAPEQPKEPHDGDPKEHARVSHRGRHLQPSESAAHALRSEAPSRPRPAGNLKGTGLTRTALATRKASREAEERSPTAPHGNPSQSETQNPPTCTKRPGRVANRACGDPHPTPLW